MSQLDNAVAKLAAVAREALLATSQDGDTAKLHEQAQALTEAASDVEILSGDVDAPPIYTGWAGDPAQL